MSHVPSYVYILFILLLWMGIARCYPRTIRVERLLIMPALMLALGIRGFFGLFSSASPIDLLAAVCGTAIGLMIGYHHVRAWSITVDRAQRTISLPGDIMMLVVILAAFVFEFALHYIIEAGMVAATNPILLFAAAALWMTFIGMSIGRNLTLAVEYARSSGTAKNM